jgi:1,4-alpha-glucan branching enzyme
MDMEENFHEIKNGRVWVTFRTPPIDGCSCLYLVGKFDDWDESVYRMQRADDGTWSLALELEPGCKYQYCYRTDNGVWHTRPVTRMYMPNSNTSDQPVRPR